MDTNRNSSIFGYLSVALIISLVVNFSYLLLLVVSSDDSFRSRNRGDGKDEVIITAEGTLSLSVDGFGYIITDEDDSIYVDRRSAYWLELKNGDRLVVEASTNSRYPDSHFAMRHIDLRNGEPFDYASLYNGPSRLVETIYQLLYYLAVSFVLMLVMNMRGRNGNFSGFVKRGVICALIAVVAYFVAPVTLRHSGEMVMLYQGHSLIDFVVLMKCLFMLVVVLLYSHIYVLIYQRQQILIENERLQNENLTTRYNMLVGQINPHFLFNSLNSLSMLVREKDDRKALKYIDQLSYTFRYITQNGSGTDLVSVREELQFAEAYSYLYKIRYADKIAFDTVVDEKYLDWQLPPLSLQPLIGNAVKHNAITSKHRFVIRIYADGGYLVVSNCRYPMLEPQVGTGTGLKNLSSRYKLLLERDIEIVSSDEEFVVRLPLQSPKS